MKKIHFETETDGFYGAYWKCKNNSDTAMILMIGDDPEDYRARSGVGGFKRNITFSGLAALVDEIDYYNF